MESAEKIAALAPLAMDQFGLAEFLRENGGLPSSVIKKQAPQQPVNTNPNSEQDDIASIIKNAGGIIPQEQQAINDYKNAKKTQLVADKATSPETMGAAGAQAGV